MTGSLHLCRFRLLYGSKGPGPTAILEADENWECRSPFQPSATSCCHHRRRSIATTIARPDVAGQREGLDKPSILLILADDLGYGDVRCYNDQSKVATPHLDRLAREGMRFTDAHSPATVCTPTRYSLMTGQMAFRVPNGGTVFTGVGGPSLIAPGRLTLPAMLKQQGYATAAVGKWHIGLTFRDQTGEPIHRGKDWKTVRRIDPFHAPHRRRPGGPRLRALLRHRVLSHDGLALRLHRERPRARAACRPARQVEAAQAPLRQRLPRRFHRHEFSDGGSGPRLPEEEPRVPRTAWASASRRANRSSSITPRRPCICRRSPRRSSKAQVRRPARTAISSISSIGSSATDRARWRNSASPTTRSSFSPATTAREVGSVWSTCVPTTPTTARVRGAA